MLILCAAALAHATSSHDGYVLQKGNTWTLGTSKVERAIRLDGGRFVTTSWKNKASGHEIIPTGTVSNELSVVVDGQEISGTSGEWRLVGAQDQTLAQGEIQLEITVRQGSLEATKTYVVYPGSSIIREWVKFKNAGTTAIKLTKPGFVNLTAKVGSPESQDFYWMTGGENYPGSWTLKPEKLTPDKAREFDSYDPMGGTPNGNFAGDGVLARVLLNDRQIWPVRYEDWAWSWQHREWRYIANASANVPVDISTKVVAGDRLTFVLNRYGTAAFDETIFDPTIAYPDGERHLASEEFSNEQGNHGWRYQYLEGAKLFDLTYCASTDQWRKVGDNVAPSMFIGAREMQPGNREDSVRVWVAPKAGKVRITASLVNSGNPPVAAAGRSFRMGSSTYAPWNALMDRQTGEGLFLGWDFFGHWSSTFKADANGAVNAQFLIPGYDRMLAPGEQLALPMAHVGLFMKDLDNAGNECLDWQYQYLWDYTRDPWFPAIRISGWWWKGSSFQDVLDFGVEGSADIDSMFRKIFRVTDLMSQLGADVYHRDWGWWDRAGDWNGPDFKTAGNYLRKHGMAQLIYSYIYNLDLNSKVAREHPDWVVSYGPWTQRTFDMAKPDVVAHLKKQLDQFVERFGPFEWKTDSLPTGFLTIQPGGDTALLDQDRSFRDILYCFLDKHPDCAFESCNAGGNGMGYEYTRLSSSGSFNDGSVGILRNYWASSFSRPTNSRKMATTGNWISSTRRSIADCLP